MDNEVVDDAMDRVVDNGHAIGEPCMVSLVITHVSMYSTCSWHMYSTYMNACE